MDSLLITSLVVLCAVTFGTLMYRLKAFTSRVFFWVVFSFFIGLLPLLARCAYLFLGSKPIQAEDFSHEGHPFIIGAVLCADGLGRLWKSDYERSRVGRRLTSDKLTFFYVVKTLCFITILAVTIFYTSCVARIEEQTISKHNLSWAALMMLAGCVIVSFGAVSAEDLE